jgi:hypothetical protein
MMTKLISEGRDEAGRDTLLKRRSFSFQRIPLTPRGMARCKQPPLPGQKELTRPLGRLASLWVPLEPLTAVAVLS